MKKIEFKFRKLFSWKSLGSIQSFFKWEWLDLYDYRKFQYGDEPRYINWKLSAKHWDRFIKMFRQEKDTDVHIFFDINKNWDTGMTYLNKERVFDVYSDIVIMAKKYWANLFGMYYDANWNHKTIKIWKDFIKANRFIYEVDIEIKKYWLQYISNIWKFVDYQKKINKSHVIIIFSDFYGLTDDCMKLLKVFTKKNELIMIGISVTEMIWYGYDRFSFETHDLYDVSKFRHYKLDDLVYHQ